MKRYLKTKLAILLLATLVTVYAMFAGISIASMLTQSGDAYVLLPAFVMLYAAAMFILWYIVARSFRKLNKIKDSE
jgi:Kef-type K+ transport system membrane component KefB